MDKVLPPLPPSDAGSLEKNSYSGFYNWKARDFWGPNEVTRIEITPDKKCQHEFKATPRGAECTKCHFGLMGPIEVKEGRLFHKGDQIKF